MMLNERAREWTTRFTLVLSSGNTCCLILASIKKQSITRAVKVTRHYQHVVQIHYIVILIRIFSLWAVILLFEHVFNAKCSEAFEGCQCLCFMKNESRYIQEKTSQSIMIKYGLGHLNGLTALVVTCQSISDVLWLLVFMRLYSWCTGVLSDFTSTQLHLISSSTDLRSVLLEKEKNPIIFFVCSFVVLKALHRFWSNVL